MSDRVPYDGLAEIYDLWVDSVPITGAMRGFYVDLMSGADDPVVELGVGNGRICLEAARRGRRVIGVDSSRQMLDLCRRRAEAAGIADRVELLHGDFRDFELGEAASLIALPFHSIGHLATDDDKLACMRRVRAQLAPGGRFVWDHFVFDPEYPIPSGMLSLRAAEIGSDGGGRLVWESSSRDVERQMVDVLIRIERLGPGGVLEETRCVETAMSWLEPDRSRELLETAGFEIEDLWGDFERGPFGADSSHQVWCARRPGGG